MNSEDVCECGHTREWHTFPDQANGSCQFDEEPETMGYSAEHGYPHGTICLCERFREARR